MAVIGLLMAGAWILTVGAASAVEMWYALREGEGPTDYAPLIFLGLYILAGYGLGLPGVLSLLDWRTALRLIGALVVAGLLLFICGLAYNEPLCFVVLVVGPILAAVSALLSHSLHTRADQTASARVTLALVGSGIVCLLLFVPFSVRLVAVMGPALALCVIGFILARPKRPSE